jgi:hypothetical protein
MSGIEAAFIFGLLLGLFAGLWIGGRMLLSRMHKDDVTDAHKRYEGRKEKYLK